jgi:hypothetical protein
MSRKRPKTLNRDPSRHGPLRRRWRRWLPSLNQDLADLLGRREIFWGLQDVAKENPHVLQHGALFDWMCTNYVMAATMAVRRLVDLRGDVQSLGRLLYEILQNPGVINRHANRSLYRGSGRLLHLNLADMTFDNLVGVGLSALPQSHVERDLRAIETAAQKVVKFTHKRVAHRAAPGELRRNPTFIELDGAMDVLDKTFCKYNCLLTASGMSSTFATRQYSWKEALTQPWIKP